jgi:Protein of unknown function (DUF3501)
LDRIDVSEVKDLVEYEKAREAMRARIIDLKKSRRVSAGENLTLLFENRDTVLFQIQEMVRTERIVEADKVRDEVDAYNALIPEPGELSATLFIEIPDLVRMGSDEVRRTVNRFQGLDRGGVSLRIGDRFDVPARFEAGHSKEEKMAAVHYVRFPLPPAARAALADRRQAVRLVVSHPNYRAEAEIPEAVRGQLIADLG